MQNNQLDKLTKIESNILVQIDKRNPGSSWLSALTSAIGDSY